MPDSPPVYVCPGCGRPVEPGEDYVIAEEYKLQSEFALHLKREGSDEEGFVSDSHVQSPGRCR